MFEGFREETMQFLWGVRLNNQRSWFLEHKAMYETFLYQPLKELGAEVQEELHRRQPESQFNVHVSRIYRDARRLHGRGPYKDHLWFTLRPTVEQWATVEPVFYFEIYPEGYEYGMGYYCPKPSLMAAYRQHILDNPERMETLAQKLNEQDLFHLEGEEYKRPKGTVSQLLQPWFNRKNLSLCTAFPPDETLFSHSLVLTLAEGYQWLWPYYRFLKEIQVPLDGRDR